MRIQKLTMYIVIFTFGLDRIDITFVSSPMMCGVSVCNHIDIQFMTMNQSRVKYESK
jgi:hypothetical protein